MKKFYNLLMMATLCMGGFWVTSCEPDYDTLDAIDISGEWTGDLGVWYNDGRYTYDAVSSYIVFYPDYQYARHGYGEEVDYFNRYSPIHYQNYYFEWEIRGHVLYLYFPYNHSLDMQLYDYEFARGRTEFHFTLGGEHYYLLKLSNFYPNWEWYNGYLYESSYYDHYYSYTPWNYYYSKDREGKDNVEMSEDAPKFDYEINPDNFTFGRNLKKK